MDWSVFDGSKGYKLTLPGYFPHHSKFKNTTRPKPESE